LQAFQIALQSSTAFLDKEAHHRDVIRRQKIRDPNESAADFSDCKSLHGSVMMFEKVYHRVGNPYCTKNKSGNLLRLPDFFQLGCGDTQPFQIAVSNGGLTEAWRCRFGSQSYPGWRAIQNKTANPQVIEIKL
jgi:hypothetical protein